MGAGKTRGEKMKLSVSPAAALVAALALLLSDAELIAAAVAAVMVHELAHIAVLQLYGLRIREISAQAQGLCIRYTGCAPPLGELLSAAAGPAAGLIYALLARYTPAQGGQWFALSGRISLLLSAFNLLPALPLDGGRIMLALAQAALGESRGAAFADTISIAAWLALGGTLALYVLHRYL